MQTTEMTNEPPFHLPGETVSENNGSPFTSTQLDMFPPLPTLPPIGETDLLQSVDHDRMASYAHLQQENNQLKAQLVGIRAQREAEQHAYRAFLTSAESLNTQLPPQARTPAMRSALQNLVVTSRRYRELATALNQHFDRIRDLPPNSLPRQTAIDSTSYSTRLVNTPNMYDGYSQRPPPSYPPHPFDAKVQYEGTASTIKATLAQLQIHRPLEPPSLEQALARLQNNIVSFAEFLASYLNMRHKHVTSELRSQINGVIGGFFADPEDARQTVSKVMRVLRDGVKYDEGGVQGLGRDIIDPTGEVLWALVWLLEKEGFQRTSPNEAISRP